MKTKNTIIITLACALALTATHVALAWQGPSGNPPANNTPAPINVSGQSQTKIGDLLVDGYLRGGALRSFGKALINYATAAEIPTVTTFTELALAVKGKVGANQYCDEQGTNCFSPSQVGTGGTTGSGDGMPTGAVLAFDLDSCPAGWTAYTAAGGRNIIGTDATYARGSTGGAPTHTLTEAQMPAHSHNMGLGNIGQESVQGGSGHNVIAPKTGGRSSTNNAGSGQAHPIMDPYIALLYCKKN
jgi:microcystin-dependent protein